MSTRYLVDSSVWAEFLSTGADGWAADLADMLRDGMVVICGPVLAEVMSGAPGGQREEIAARLRLLPWVDLTLADWTAVGIVSAQLRARAELVPLTDVVVAFCARRAGASMWTADSDFQRLAAAIAEIDEHARLPG